MSKILILNLLKKFHIEYFLKGHLIILNLSKKKLLLDTSMSCLKSLVTVAH